jgi:DNA-binding transcriptional LysR family regulator
VLSRSELDAVEIRYLRYALASAEHRSFRRAAEALRIKQSTLSRRIREMELRFGVELFARSPTGVRPTEAAAPFLRTASALVETAVSMAEAIKATGRGECGRLRLGVCGSPFTGALRHLLVSFRTSSPGVEIHIEEAADLGLQRRLEMGVIDVAIVPGEKSGRSAGSLALWSERIFIALPEAHPLVARENLSWSDLRNETLLLADQPDAASGVEAMAFSKLGAGGRVRVRRHGVARGQVISLVACGLGFAVLTEGSAAMSCRGVVYREVCEPHGSIRFGYVAHWRPDSPNPVLQRFLRLLQEQYPPVEGVAASPP